MGLISRLRIQADALSEYIGDLASNERWTRYPGGVFDNRPTRTDDPMKEPEGLEKHDTPYTRYEPQKSNDS